MATMFLQSSQWLCADDGTLPQGKGDTLQSTVFYCPRWRRSNKRPVEVNVARARAFSQHYRVSGSKPRRIVRRAVDLSGANYGTATVQQACLAQYRGAGPKSKKTRSASCCYCCRCCRCFVHAWLDRELALRHTPSTRSSLVGQPGRPAYSTRSRSKIRACARFNLPVLRPF